MTFETLCGSALDLEINSNDSAVLYTTARRQTAVNQGQAEFADLTECLARQSTFAVSCNTAEYNLLTATGSTDFARMAKAGAEYRVRSSGGRWLTWLTGKDFPERPEVWRNTETRSWRMSTTPTQPTGWYQRVDGGALYFGLDQPPDVGSSEAADVVLHYLAQPAAMASSSAEPWTVSGSVRTDLRPYQQACVHYAAYKLLPLAGDQQGAQLQLQKFLGYVARYAQAMRQRGGTAVKLGVNYLARSRARRLQDALIVPETQFD